MNMLNDDDFAILSSKALLGDMLSMIVHQWKQPLSIINILYRIIYESIKNSAFCKYRINIIYKLHVSSTSPCNSF